MPIVEYKGKLPKIGKNCFVAETAVLVGDVTLKDGANIWYGAVLRGDLAPIVIGENSNVQDNCVVHIDEGIPTILGDNVTVGHGAIIHACTIEDNCLIGMGATVLDNAHVGRASIIGAGAVVSPRSVIPPFSQVLGIPGKVVKTLAPETEEDRIKHALSYVETAQDYIK